MRVQSAVLSLLMLLLAVAACARELRQDKGVKCPPEVLQKATSKALLNSPKRLEAVKTACAQRANSKCYEDCFCTSVKDSLQAVIKAIEASKPESASKAYNTGYACGVVIGSRAWDSSWGVPEHVRDFLGNPANKCDVALTTSSIEQACTAKIVQENGRN